VVAVSGDRLQGARGAEALGLAGKLIDGPPEPTAIFDFPYAGSTGDIKGVQGPQGTTRIEFRRSCVTITKPREDFKNDQKKVC